MNKTDIFIKKSKLIHNDKYDYSKVNYIHSKKKVMIICSEHGIFEQIPSGHLSGKGCYSCYGNKKSDNRTFISNSKLIHNNKYDYSLVNIINRQVRIGRYIVDGYNPETNTIYEFNGDFWHGNPEIFDRNDFNKVSRKTFGELYKKTLEKENKLKELGYNIISIWESEYKNNYDYNE